HIGSWYYLVVAEGGTGYSHCVTIARSDNVFGPYETMPDNPLLTSDQNDLTAIQKCGHGSFVETQNGEWYMAHLCSRPNSARGSLLGRETALQKITWQDGWPRLACGGKIAQNAVPAPKDLPEVELPAMAEQDDFDVPALAPGYATPRTPLGDCVNLTVRPGWLRLTGQESMNSLHHVTLVASRQQEHEMQAETRMDFAPVCPEQMAGFTYCYDSMNFYLLGKTCAEDGTPVLELLKSDTGVVEDVCDPVPVPDGTLDFKLTTTPDGGMAQFYYRQPQGEWQSIGPACPTDILTDEHCRGFTGAHVGVYAHDMAGLHNHADFDYLNVHFER
uniref:beta-xylosidase family glycoside hydrolase n=1 Tax=Gemmiger qucibialis TaxID=2997294 RepID=UPI003FEEA124